MATSKTDTGTGAELDSEKTRSIVRYKLVDGTTVDVDPSKMSDIITLERELGRPFNGNATEDQMRLAWMRAGHPGGTGDEAFLEWVDGIEDAETVSVPRPTKGRRPSSAA